MPVSEIPLKGAHNVENVLAAVCAARLAGVSGGCSRFVGRCWASRRWSIGWKFVRSVNGEWVTTTIRKATNVDATMKAVSSFDGGIHLILGGKDKDSDYGLMADLLKERVKVVYTIGSKRRKRLSTNCVEGREDEVSGNDAGGCERCRRSRGCGRWGAAGSGVFRASTSLRIMSIAAACFAAAGAGNLQERKN